LNIEIDPCRNDAVSFPGICVCCCLVPGTEEDTVYSTGKVDEIRGCGCGNAVLTRYATLKVRICPDCRKKISIAVSRCRKINLSIATVLSVVAYTGYYILAGQDVYVSFIAATIPFLAGYRWIVFDERMASRKFIGKLVKTGTKENTHVPVFLNKKKFMTCIPKKKKKQCYF